MNNSDTPPPINDCPQGTAVSYLISIEKWVALISLTCASIFFGLVPKLIFRRGKHSSAGVIGNRNKDYTKRKSYTRGLAFLSSLSGGVLLGTTMLHILPEVREKAEDMEFSILGLNLPKSYPLLAELLMLYGFCLIYLFEVLAHIVLGRYHKHSHNKELSNKSLINGVETTGQSEVKQAEGSWRVLISLAALSLHATMEGVAIGVQHASRLWYAFGAIASHKFIISFCLGMELVRSKASSCTLVGSIVTFSIVSPIGIILGSSAQATMDANSTVLVIIEGLACGTLLYVVFFEILTTDQTNHNHSDGNRNVGDCDTDKSDGVVGLIQFIGTFVGIVLCTALMSGEESHSHSHGASSLSSHD